MQIKAIRRNQYMIILQAK